jgi:glycosyltransferase involved in cell wall biosynthesis
MNKPSFSILLSVYAKELPNHLDRCFQSLADQHVKADEVIVVEDGPLPDILHDVIENWRETIHISSICLKKNRGLGKALHRGLEACSHDLVARMDSDDICHPERFAKQVDFMNKHPKIDVVGTWISEFDGNETNIYAYRKLPVSPADIASFARRRNPLNHMSVMFRKTKVLAAGGYGQFTHIQDYHLWARMLINGSRMANIPEYLVNVRAGAEMIRRRGGKDYARIELKLQKEFLEMGFINRAEFIRNVSFRYGVRLMPHIARKQVYKLLRS